MNHDSKEIEEELGVAVAVINGLGETIYSYAHHTVHTIFLRCQIVGKDEPKCLVHEELKWIVFSELENYDFLEADREFVAKLPWVLGGRDLFFHE